MVDRYLKTKFHIPNWRSGGITRPRLVERMHAGLDEQRKLTLVSAPAGYGKTTLVVEWLSNKGEDRLPSDVIHPRYQVAWLSLDEADNDPARFLGYWLAALQCADDSLGQSAQSLLGMPQIPPLNELFCEVINDLAALETQIILVLDDFHVISNPGIHDTLEYFLHHQPEQFHLVIITRVDPPLPLSRLRAQSQMTEIRADDLRFTPEEARHFFSQSMNLDLTEGTVNTIVTRTEGWAVGLQLSALAMQNLPDPQDFLSDFSGSHRFVIDYLLDEVLKQQPEEIRTFLSKTAVLERFNAELCRAVTGNPASAAILTDLERSNLFLIPLDDQRDWYRYHHLFADALRAGLDASSEREIHKIAAAWLEGQGFFSEAITYWLAVPNAIQAASLINQLAPDLLKTGELQTLLGWLNALPEAIVNQNPELVAYKALCLLMTGQTALAHDYASQTYQTLPEQTLGSGHGRLLAMQAWFAVMVGEQRTAVFARAALDQLDETDLFFRAWALIALSKTHAWDADLPASTHILREAWVLGKQLNHHFIVLIAAANLAFNLLHMGQLREAESLCRATLSEYLDSRGRHLPILGILYVPLASICFEKGNFDEAEDLAERSITLCQRLFSNTSLGGNGEMTLARTAFERGKPQVAFDLLQSTAETARQHGIKLVVYRMEVVQTELYILQGRLAEAEIHLQELEMMALSGVSNAELTTAYLRARFLTASGQTGKALEILNRLEEADRAKGYLRRLIGTHITQALAYHQQGEPALASHAMESALRLAAPESYFSLFIPHPGRPILPLLKSARAVAPNFVDSILKNLPATEEGLTPVNTLIEPLSAQEIRVLKLIVAGRSNQQVAEELVISLGTAKWHVHNVLQKLGVSNRPQAIARARELDLT